MFAFTIRNTGGTDDPTTSSSPSLTNETFLVSAYRTNDRRYLNFNGGELLNMATLVQLATDPTPTYLQLEGIMKATTSNHLTDT